MQRIIEFIRELERRREFGALTLKIESGKVSLVKWEQTIKPENLGRAFAGETVGRKRA